MKNLIITIIFAIGLGMSLNAQSDGFFTYNNIDEHRTGSDSWGIMPKLPVSHGFTEDQNAAPLGSGLLILGGMALGYAARRKRD